MAAVPSEANPKITWGFFPHLTLNGLKFIHTSVLLFVRMVIFFSSRHEISFPVGSNGV